MELINLHAVKGEYEDSREYSYALMKTDSNAILNALSSPTSPLIRSIISDLEEKERSLELYLP